MTERGATEPVARAVMAVLRAYRRWLSPLKGAPSCRFHPTCSAYALEAVERHGAVRGLGLAARRILKCHPFHPGGLDPVPGTSVPEMSVPGTSILETSVPETASRRPVATTEEP